MIVAAFEDGEMSPAKTGSLFSPQFRFPAAENSDNQTVAAQTGNNLVYNSNSDAQEPPSPSYQATHHQQQVSGLPANDVTAASADSEPVTFTLPSDGMAGSSVTPADSDDDEVFITSVPQVRLGHFMESLSLLELPEYHKYSCNAD